MKIHLAHSPDADDAFMFYPLLQGKIDRGGIEIVDVQEDIETLNQKATEGIYEVTAVSFHAFPYIADKYLLLTTGACFGDRYGPLVVAAKPLKPRQLLKVRMGIPGKRTTAFLVLKLYEHHLAGEGKSGICYSQVPFDQIMDQIVAGKIDAGLIIHEGQLTFAEKGLHKIVDLGEWWHKETGLALPLGGIAIRRDLAPELQREVARLIQESIKYSLEHKEEALQQALPFARGLDPERAAKFIEMYVNEMTVDFGRKGLKAIKTLLEKGFESGILTERVDLDDYLFDLKKGRPAPVTEPLPEPVSESAPQGQTQPPESPPDNPEDTEKIPPEGTT
jgi:1,4-dihydroxy-6-naphthoate synthase